MILLKVSSTVIYLFIHKREPVFPFLLFLLTIAIMTGYLGHPIPKRVGPRNAMRYPAHHEERCEGVPVESECLNPRALQNQRTLKNERL